VVEQTLVVRRDLGLGQDAVGPCDGRVDLLVAAEADGHAGHDPRGGAAGGLGGAHDVGNDVRADGALVGHPEDGPVGALAGQPEHRRAERGEEQRGGRHVRDVERAVHPEQLVVDVDATGTGEGLVEDVEVGAHGRRRALVGQAQHLVDDPMVGDAEAQREAALAHGLDRQRLLCQGDRMTGLHRNDRRADLDARRLRPDDRGRRQGVELVGDLGDPDRRETGLVRPACVGAQTVDLRAVATPLRADDHPDAHPAPLPRGRLRE
jgi:hypothetical protein